MILAVRYIMLFTNGILLQSGEHTLYGVYRSSMHMDTNRDVNFGIICAKMLCGACQMGRAVNDFGVSFVIWSQSCVLLAIINACSSSTCKLNTLFKGSIESCQNG